jgi:ribosomal protein S12 methylthiotransferase
MKVHLVSLGCPKNLVDSEKILGALGASGIDIAVSPEDSDVVIINTCGFIEPARRETEQEITSMVERIRGQDTRLYVLGCAVNRFGNELKLAFPHVTEWFRLEQTTDLLRAISSESVTKKSRLVSTRGYAYLKIAEGCSHNCAYCTIPSIKGTYRSRPLEELEQETHELAQLGCREIILIAQDTAHYGADLYGWSQTHVLMQRLSRIDGVSWIRLLYAHPKSVTHELLHEIATNSKVCKYVDLPIQHISDRVLKVMNRGVTRRHIERIVSDAKKIKHISLRTTVIAGLPSETEDEFMELVNFLEKGLFDWLGVFPYYHECGTPAAGMEQVPDSVIQVRYNKLLKLQEKRAEQRTRKRLGEVHRTLIHSDNCVYRGHAGFSAPEIDGEIMIRQRNIKLGHFYHIRIIGTKGCDFIGEVL